MSNIPNLLVYVLFLHQTLPFRHWRSTEVKSAKNNSMEVFKGKFERTSAENYEEFLKAMDVGYLLRKAATVSTPTLEVTESGGVWSFKTSTTLKSIDLKFKVSLSKPDRPH